jgi:hypothetical protein
VHGRWWWYEGAETKNVLDTGESMYAFSVAGAAGAEEVSEVDMWLALPSTKYPGEARPGAHNSSSVAFVTNGPSS